MDFERSSSCWEGERDRDLAARSSFPFSIGDGERLRDFCSPPFSLDRLRESRSDFTLERLFERDLRSAERERELDFWEVERDLRLRDRDLLPPDFLPPDLERERRPSLLLWDRDLQ